MEQLKERIEEVAKYKGVSIRQMESACQLKRGNLSNISKDGTIGLDKASKILDAFSDISPDWLISGRGSMLRSPQANRTGHVVVSNDFKGGTNHIGDISISNGIEAPSLSAKEGQDAGDQSIRDRQHLIAEIERLKSMLKTQESMIEWLKQKCDEEAAHNRSLVNELLGKNKA